MRTAALGLLGLVLAVVVGYGVHLITRGTISLPVVQLEQPAPLAPPAATTHRTHDDQPRPRPRERRPRIAARKPMTTAGRARRAKAEGVGAAVVATTTEA